MDFLEHILKFKDKFLINKKLSISMTIALEVDEKILTDRLISRGKDSGRVDDQDRSKIKNRFEQYNKKTSTLINYYRSQDKFFEIEGTGEISEISERIFNVIDSNI